MNDAELVAYNKWRELVQRHEKLDIQAWEARQAANAIEKEKDAVNNDLADAYSALRKVLKQGATK